MTQRIALSNIEQTPTPHGVRWSCTVDVPLSTGLFDGHFPEMPILPGVAQLLLVNALLRRAVGESTSIAAIGQWKLRARVAPEASVRVSIEPTGVASGWRFALTDPRGGPISNGTLTVAV
ncbi:MAG: hypothetical protein U0V87_12495 [Acidobacteriota bacterium]